APAPPSLARPGSSVRAGLDPVSPAGGLPDVLVADDRHGVSHLGDLVRERFEPTVPAGDDALLAVGEPGCPRLEDDAGDLAELLGLLAVRREPVGDDLEARDLEPEPLTDVDGRRRHVPSRQRCRRARRGEWILCLRHWVHFLPSDLLYRLAPLSPA